MGLVLDTSSIHSIGSKSDYNLRSASISFKQIADAANSVQYLVVLTWETVKRFWVPIIDLLLFESISYKPLPSISWSWIARTHISMWRSLFKQKCLLIYIEKILNRPITKFYNGYDVNMSNWNKWKFFLYCKKQSFIRNNANRCK